MTNTVLIHLVEVFLEQAVEPRFGDFHRSQLIRDITTLHQNHLQLQSVQCCLYSTRPIFK